MHNEVTLINILSGHSCFTGAETVKALVTRWQDWGRRENLSIRFVGRVRRVSQSF